MILFYRSWLIIAGICAGLHKIFQCEKGKVFLSQVFHLLRNGIHIIDLQKTIKKIEDACQAVDISDDTDDLQADNATTYSIASGDLDDDDDLDIDIDEDDDSPDNEVDLGGDDDLGVETKSKGDDDDVDEALAHDLLGRPAGERGDRAVPRLRAR